MVAVSDMGVDLAKARQAEASFFGPDPSAGRISPRLRTPIPCQAGGRPRLALSRAAKPEVDASRKLVDMSFSPTLAGRDCTACMLSHTWRLSSPAAAPRTGIAEAITVHFWNEEKAASVPDSPRHEKYFGRRVPVSRPLARKNGGNVQQIACVIGSGHQPRYRGPYGSLVRGEMTSVAKV